MCPNSACFMNRHDPIRRSWMLWFVVTQHVLTGLVLLSYPEAHIATPVHAVTIWFGVKLAIVNYFVVSGLAAISLLASLWPVFLRLIFLLPQQTLVLLAAFGAVFAVLNGHYADGTIVARPHIFVDQLACILAVVFHTVALLHLHLFADNAKF